MKTAATTILLVFTFSVQHSFSAGDLESTLNHCCNTGKTWSMEKKSCNITLSFPLFNVNVEHNTMCLTTVGACCLQSLREIRCNEGKQVGLENGICNEKPQMGRNQVDFMMCCEICKIGVAVGSTKTICQSTPLFHEHQWGEVYQSCCSIATTKVKSISTETKKKYVAAAESNDCTLGTHSCTSSEICISTNNGFECQPRLLPLTMSMVPEKLTMYKKKQICDPGYAYNVYGQKCEDIDECSQQPCEINEQCKNLPGSYKCHCKSGYQLDKVTNACTDINECQLNLHTCQESQRCDNTAGSFQCIRFTGCGTGYTLDVESASCIDDDECALKTDTCGVLGPDWICRNTLGSFRCDKKRCTGPNCRVIQGAFNNTNQSNRSSVRCLRGYETDQNNKCTDINECRLANRCLKNEMCINTNGSYYCLPRSKNSLR
ncbi:fibulin-1 [Acyrthosiphon pisum]|uniref:EGF-like domain-containing protein n=1 Tax=Acyrthosiphon pisum TaxID=7029 RepID=A0A8R1W7L1_ACYPI|nr:fibulin-1 [Acyrthosiphon pisum]|eukprot:XP_003243058.1 PREDICTED: fibulin-1 [Acyrthosiphon pisum]